MFDWARDLKWSLKGKYVGIFSAVVVVLGGFSLGWVLRGNGSDLVREEVRGAIVLLRSDFEGGAAELGGTYIRHFRGELDGDIVGEVTRKVDQGTCWGFEVVFPQKWLISGEGSIEVSEEKQYPSEMCRETP